MRQAVLAERAGFSHCLVSDHYHPWTDAQGQSPLVWTTLGGIANATEKIAVGTGVTCPLIRQHPGLVAQAAATVAGGGDASRMRHRTGRTRSRTSS